MAQQGAAPSPGTTATVPAPIGGWNARDGLSVMEAQFAVQLDDIFPDQDGVSTRNGSTKINNSDLDSKAETLYAHHVGATKVLLAYTETSIYNVTSPTPVSLKTGLSNGRWSVVTLGSNSIMVNGVDAAQKFNGTAISANVFTGPANVNQLVGLHVYRDRLFAWKAGVQAFQYLQAPDAIAGALGTYDLSYVTNLKGSIVAMATWTFDGGDGVDDQLVIVFDSGQVVVYTGSDPGTAANWQIVGTFKIPAPIGNRCVQQYGGDVIISTAEGYYPISKALPFGNLSNAVSISDLINPEVGKSYRLKGTAFGWDVVFYSHRSMMIFNVPQGDDTFVQYVMNTRTNAWCRFTKLNARAWAVLDGTLYFSGLNGLGDNEGIYRALSDEDLTDDGAEIVGYSRQAYNAFQAPALTKKINMVLPTINPTAAADVYIGFGAEFNVAASKYPLPPFVVVGVFWDADDAIWDEAPWAGDVGTFSRWVRANGKGKYLSFEMEIHTSDGVVKWFNTSFLYEIGGVL